MKGYDPERHRRRSIRLRGHDYAAPRAYFVTICTHGRLCVFGSICGGQLTLSPAGHMVAAILRALPERFPAIEPDALVIMPNHVHAIIATTSSLAEPAARPPLGAIVGALKSLTTNAYARGVREQGWRPFEGRLWQRNYYERIVRDEADLGRVRAYIEQNPARWEEDDLHPAAAPGRRRQE